MAVGIVAAMVFLIYLMCVPVKFALKIRTEPKMGYGAGIAIFEGRFALRKAEKRIEGEKKHLPWAKISLDAEKIRSLKAIKYLIRHLKIEYLSFSGSLALGDAAATAMACGCAEAAYAAVLPFDSEGRISLRLKPDFTGGRSDLQFSGMVSAAAGHIICTALLCAVYLAEGRLKKWKDTRLRIL